VWLLVYMRGVYMCVCVWLQRGLELGAVLSAACQVGSGLQHLHDLGLLHLDVRAASVLIASSPTEPLQVQDLFGVRFVVCMGYCRH
jgi:hypothetical protein